MKELTTKSMLKLHRCLFSRIPYTNDIDDKKNYFCWRITREDITKPILIHWKYFTKEELETNRLVEIY